MNAPAAPGGTKRRVQLQKALLQAITVSIEIASLFHLMVRLSLPSLIKPVAEATEEMGGKTQRGGHEPLRGGVAARAYSATLGRAL